MKEIKNRIKAQKLVKWRECTWLQNDNLKELSPENFEKLKNSLSNNNFIQPFNIWVDGKNKMWILDGHHRQKAMQELEAEGVKIPVKLPAVIIDCKNKKEAAKLVLLYSSKYADMTEHGLKEFLELNSLVLEDIEAETDFSGLDLELLKINPDDDFKESKDLNIVETAKNMSDVYIIIGEYRILLERDIYLNWIDDLKGKVGFDKSSVAKEIKKRLRIN